MRDAREEHDQACDRIVRRAVGSALMGVGLIGFMAVTFPRFPAESRIGGAIALACIMGMGVGYLVGKATK